MQNEVDAVIYADAKGVIGFWNKGTELIFGFSEEEAVGQSLDIMFPENIHKRHWDGYDETMRTGKTRCGAGDLLAVPPLHKNRSHVSIVFTSLPFRGDVGRTSNITLIRPDVTKRFQEVKSLRKELLAGLSTAGRQSELSSGNLLGRARMES